MGSLEALGPEAALLALPFVVYALVWGLGRLFLGDVMGAPDDRVEPPTPNHQSRVIPGGRRDGSE